MNYVRTRIDRDALTGLRTTIQAGLAVRALARANPAATSPDSVLRFRRIVWRLGGGVRQHHS